MIQERALKNKRWPVCMAVVAALLPLTCGSGSNFDVPEASTAAVTASSSKSSLDFPDYESLDISKNAVVSKQALASNQFESVKLLTFSLTGANGADLSFVSDIKFYIQGSGQARQLIAQATSFEKMQNVAYLEVIDVEMAPHFKGGPVTITNEATLALPTTSVNLIAEPIFDVHVQNFPSACAR